MADLVVLSGVSVSYGCRDVLANVHLVVRDGEFISIVGKSGVGKTSLLRAIGGLVPFSGNIACPPRKGMVFQNDSVFPWMTVSQNIAFGLEEYDPSAKRRIVDRHLAVAGLWSLRDSFPSELSGGQVQRVAIARAFAPRPSFVLMDEPFASLDMQTRDSMHRWLEEVWSDEKMTIILVTHYIDEAILLSDRVIVLREGGRLDDLKVDLPRPRDAGMVFEPGFLELKRKIVECLGV